MDGPDAVLKLDDQNPWPGLAAYDEASRHYFHGREQDAAELLHISPRVMNYKIKTLAIEMPRRRVLASVS